MTATSNSEKFKIKCYTLLLEGRCQDGEFGLKLNSEQLKKSIYISYLEKYNAYLEKLNEKNLFRPASDELLKENRDLKACLILEQRHNNKLKKLIGLDFIEEITERDETIKLQANSILQLKCTIAKLQQK